MNTRKAMTKVSALYSIFFLLPPALCHMEMSWPYPLRSKYNPANNYENIDYSMTSPLSADGSNFPCKGYQNDRPIETTATYATGSTYNMSLEGSATHGGGSCQLSLSYDNGATFRVIKSMIGGCPLVSTYDFTIPLYAPTGNALLAWTWQNYEGNREFYMNCAEVNIISGMSRRRRRQTYNSFDSLPYIWKANLAGVNDCETTEGEDPVYPDAGPDVEYGNGLNSSSPATSGDCDASTPYGQTYEAMENSSTPDASSYAQSPPMQTSSSSAGSEPTMYSTSSTDIETSMAMANAYPTSLDSNANQRGAAASAQSTTTVTINCPSTVTVTITPDAGTATVTTTNSPTASSTPSTVVVMSTATVVPVQATSGAATTSQVPTPAQTAATTYSQPPYASGDVESYLPCVPGTFICTSNTTWDTCDYNDGSTSSATTYVYDYPREVSAGMECIPYLSPYSNDTQQYAQQATTPDGYYRDDRMVRARPDGDCSDEGAIQCTDDGQPFDICDQGGWVEMGYVANGTTCENGQIVASS